MQNAFKCLKDVKSFGGLVHSAGWGRWSNVARFAKARKIRLKTFTKDKPDTQWRKKKKKKLTKCLNYKKWHKTYKLAFPEPCKVWANATPRDTNRISSKLMLSDHDSKYADYGDQMMRRHFRNVFKKMPFRNCLCLIPHVWSFAQCSLHKPHSHTTLLLTSLYDRHVVIN